MVLQNYQTFKETTSNIFYLLHLYSYIIKQKNFLKKKKEFPIKKKNFLIKKKNLLTDFQKKEKKKNICSFWVETLCQGQKNSEANFCFPRKKWLFFRPKGEKTIFSEGNKCSSQSFFDPGIMFSA